MYYYTIIKCSKRKRYEHLKNHIKIILTSSIEASTYCYFTRWRFSPYPSRRTCTEFIIKNMYLKQKSITPTRGL